MALSRRPRGSDGYPRTAAQVLAAALAVSVVFLTQWAGPAASASTHSHRHASSSAITVSIHKSSSHKGRVKYYIVQPPKHGHKEFLYEIAAKTLGNGNRDTEIFKLNKGRLEPHGARMKTLTVIRPGWILLLPKDASGKGVHFGKLPVAKPVHTHSPSPSPSPSASAPAAVPPAAPPTAQPSASVSPAMGGMGVSLSPHHGISMRTMMDGGAALILLLLLLVAWLFIMMRRRRKADATQAPGGVPGGPRGPHGPHGPRRPGRTGRAARTGRATATGRAAGAPSNGLAIGAAPDLGTSGTTLPFPSPVPGGGPAALEPPPLLNVPDSLAGPMIAAQAPMYDEPAPSGHPAWMAGPAALGSAAPLDAPGVPGHPVATGSDGDFLRWPSGSDSAGGSTGAASPASMDDTGSFTWPDYLSPGISRPGPQALGRETSRNDPPTAPAQPAQTTAGPAQATTGPTQATTGPTQVTTGSTQAAAGPAGATTVRNTPPQLPTPVRQHSAGHQPAGQSPAVDLAGAESSDLEPVWDPAPMLPAPVTGPVPTGSATTGSATTGPATTGPATTRPVSTNPPAAELSTTGLSTTEPSTTGPSTTEPSTTEPPTAWPAASDPEHSDPLSADLPDEELPAAALSPVALRILGARRSSAQLAETADMPVQRHELALGDDRIQVVLAQAPAPAASHDGKPRNSRTWLTSTPYLVWSPLPYDTPDDGIAFACLGAGDEGCLFIDLAAAPGAVAIGGDGGAPGRLAESVAHQLCMGAAAGRGCIVIAIGDALPEPQPSGAAWVASLRDLGSALLPPGPDDGTEVVFCKLNSNEDAFALARYVSSAQRRVVPVVLADLPDAPWSFTAQPSRHPNEILHPAVA
jgi:hypothetical protein